MRRIVVACFALLVLGAGCDAVGQPTWAARVDGSEIPFEDVEALSRLFEQPAPDPNAPAEGTTTTTTPVMLTGSTTRDALSTFVRWELIELRLEQLDEPVGAEARQQAQQQLDESVGDFEFPSGTKERIVDGLAAALAFGPALLEHADDPVIAELLDDFYAENEATWAGWTCLEGVAVPAADRPAVDAALAAPGATIESVASAGLSGVQPLFAEGVASCIPAAGIPEDLAATLEATPDGQLIVQEQPDQTGATVALYIRELERKDIGRDDPEVLAAFSQALQAQDGQRWLDLALRATAADADIEILSTIGSGYDVETLTVIGPPVPAGATTTTLPLIPQSG